MKSAPTAFSRTTRSVLNDGYRRTWIAVSVATSVIAAWALWLVFARLSIYEVSRGARLEAYESAHPLEVPVSGAVIKTHLTLGRVVEAGEVLLELDGRSIELQLEEEKSRRDALANQLEAAKAELAATERALQDVQALAAASIREVRVEQQSAATSAELAKKSEARTQRLHAKGAATADELERAEAERRQRGLSLEATRERMKRLAMDRKAQESDNEVRIAALRRNIAGVEGELNSRIKSIARLEYQLQQCVYRAPIAGRIADVANVQVGSFLEEGKRIGTLVPPGNLRVVAEFTPQSALGRIKPGQPARLRLDSFPWFEFGSIAAKVDAIATESKDGTVRVELILDRPKEESEIPLQHGLLGVAEVEVDRVSPLVLVLRAAGRSVSDRREQTSAAPDEEPAE